MIRPEQSPFAMSAAHAMARGVGVVAGGILAWGIGGVAGEDRTIDGTGNAPGDLGAAGEVFYRVAPAAYGDGFGTLAGGDRPNARTVSNIVCAQAGSMPNTRGGSDFIWQWGQFIDHDITLTEAKTEEFENITIDDTNDVLYTPGNPERAFIPLQRSNYLTDGSGVRQQVNELTTFIDGSMVYGSDTERADFLRTMAGGRLKTATDGLLPFNTAGLPNASMGFVAADEMRIAGDVRVNEQPGLAAMHTLFVREHNRVADAVAAENPGWSDEEVYQRARKIVGAIIQAITYHEWLPALLGPHAPDPGTFSYKPSTDPRVANEFAAALFRIGHTQVSPTLRRIHDDYRPATASTVSLRDAFFNPTVIDSSADLDLLLKGLACQLHQDTDARVNEELRSFLFGPPGAGGMDLASLNIQRGREHGLPDYNTLRQAYGLPPAASFSQITSDPAAHAAMETVYVDIDDIDPWVGALVEDHLPGAVVGALTAAGFIDQFTRSAEGDRFFYLWDDALSPAERDAISQTTLSDVIARNSNLTNFHQNAFFVPTVERFEIAAIGEMTGGGMQIEFMAEPGFDYEVYYSNNFATWHNDLPDGLFESGDSVLMGSSADTSAAAPSARYYKVVRAPSAD